MKLVYVMPFMRVPPDFGLAIRDYHLLNYLAEHHSVVLMAFETPDQGALVEWAHERMADFTSLGPYPTSPKQPEKLETLQRLFEITPSALARVRPGEIARKVQGVLEKHTDIDLIVFDTHLTAQAAMHMPESGVPCVAVLLDILTNYTQRRFVRTDWRPYKLIYGMDWLRAFLYEKRILSRFRYVITMSESDAAWVRRHMPMMQVFVSQNGVDTEYFAPQDKPQDTQQMLFVGNFAYAPNEDAFFHFVNNVLPHVNRECPEARFLVVGLNPTRAMLDFSQKNTRVKIVANVPDVRPYYAQADLTVIPLRLGSGVKLKTVEAMSMGLPVVSTDVGVEGIDVQNNKHFLLADDPQAFASSVVDLLRSRSERNRLAQNGRALALRYSWKYITREFEKSLLCVQDQKNCTI